MHSEFLRFPLDTTAQGLVDPISVLLTDESDGHQSMHIEALALGWMQIRPMFPGIMRFIPDDPASQPSASALDTSSKSNLETSLTLASADLKGILHILADPRATAIVDGFGLLDCPAPNRVWYHTVTLTMDFLWDTLLNGLTPLKVAPSSGAAIEPGDPGWKAAVVAGFLSGKYTAPLKAGATAAADEAVTLSMPIVELTSGGSLLLTITTAASMTSTTDAWPLVARTLASQLLAYEKAGFPTAGSLSDKDDDFSDIRHRFNGTLPARMVFRALETKLTDSTGAVMTELTSTAEPAYQRVRFFRPWMTPGSLNCSSVFFIPHDVTVTDISDPSSPVELLSRRLPIHGIVFVPHSASTPPTDIRVSLTSSNEHAELKLTDLPMVGSFSFRAGLSTSLLFDITWLAASTTDAWNEQGSTTDLDFELASGDPGVLVRSTMRDTIIMGAITEMPRDPRGDIACTFAAVRRSVRALIDNLVTGGRMAAEPRYPTHWPTDPLTELLLDSVDTTLTALVNKGPDPLTPLEPSGPWDAANEQLRDILQFFFDDGSPAAGEGDVGEMAYYLWHTGQTVLAGWSNTPDEHRGRGGAGAIVHLGLADYKNDVAPAPMAEGPHTYSNAEISAIVDQVLSGLEPGDMIQVWDLASDYENLRTSTAEVSIGSYGHNAIFFGYVLDGSGGVEYVCCLDQSGFTLATVDEGTTPKTLWWCYERTNTTGEQIWVSASWTQ